MLNTKKEEIFGLYKTTIKDENLLEANLNLSQEQQDKILSVDGFVSGGQIKVENNLVNFSGKAFFNVIFVGEDLERVETGVHFDFKKVVDKDYVNPSVDFILEDFSVKNDGGMLFVTANLVSTITLYEEKTCSYIENVDALKKSGQIRVVKNCFFNSNMDLDDNFETVKIKKVLFNKATAMVTSCKASNNMVTCQGNAVITFVLLPFSENSDIVKEVRVVPFTYEIDCNDLLPSAVVSCNADIDKINVKVYTDEEDNKSKVETTFTISFTGVACYEVFAPCVLDAVSNTNELKFEQTEFSVERLTDRKFFSERVSNKAVVNIPEYSRFIKAVGERVFVGETTFSGDEVTITGVVEADCIFQGDNGLVAEKSQLPFTITETFSANSVYNVKVQVEGLQGRLRSGKLEQDCLLKLCFDEYSLLSQNLLTDIVEGNEKSTYRSVITVYMGRPNDTEWDVVKATGESIETINEYNPDITFPLAKEEKILILRRKD